MAAETRLSVGKATGNWTVANWRVNALCWEPAAAPVPLLQSMWPIIAHSGLKKKASQILGWGRGNS